MSTNFGLLIPLILDLVSSVSAVSNTIYSIGKYDINSNFPTIYAPVTSLTDTTYTSYGRVVKIDIAGVTGTIWIENAVGDFLDNMTLAANDGWGAAVTRALNFKVALIVTSEVSTAHKQNSHSPSPMVNPTSLILQVICSSLLMVFSNHWR